MASGAKNKTIPTKQRVSDFINSISTASRKSDCRNIMKMMSRVTGKRPKMWGPSIVGYGQYHYQYESGREGDMCMTGFSPRKRNLAIYFMSGFGQYSQQLEKLGKHKLGKSCLYINSLKDIDENVLEELIKLSFLDMQTRYSEGSR